MENQFIFLFGYYIIIIKGGVPVNRIKKLRLERGWNQDELGSKLNVKRAAISKYENEIIPLTVETISLLCKIFNVSSDYLIGLSDKRFFDNKKTASYNLAHLFEKCEELDDCQIKKIEEYIDFIKFKNTRE